jgi:hypothetical protein
MFDVRTSLDCCLYKEKTNPCLMIKDERDFCEEMRDLDERGHHPKEERLLQKGITKQTTR